MITECGGAAPGAISSDTVLPMQLELIRSAHQQLLALRASQETDARAELSLREQLMFLSYKSLARFEHEAIWSHTKPY